MVLHSEVVEANNRSNCYKARLNRLVKTLLRLKYQPVEAVEKSERVIW